MAGTPGRVRVTLNERVLVHLLDYVRFADLQEAPPDITQQGIADALGVRRSHVTLALQTLRRRGFVLDRTVRIVRATRRKKAYALTPRGYARARETLTRLAAVSRTDGPRISTTARESGRPVKTLEGHPEA